MVNNAGINRDNLAMRLTDDDWDAVIAIDLTAAFHICRAALRPMLRQRFGRIVNVSSIAGVIGNAGQSNYSAAKAGLIGLTKSLAREVASRDITVNAVAPGFIETEMTTVLSDVVRAAAVAAIPKAPDGHRRGGRRSDSVPRHARVRLHHRSRAPCRRGSRGVTEPERSDSWRPATREVVIDGASGPFAWRPPDF